MAGYGWTLVMLGCLILERGVWGVVRVPYFVLYIARVQPVREVRVLSSAAFDTDVLKVHIKTCD
jgi:hypothetical protein